MPAGAGGTSDATPLSPWFGGLDFNWEGIYGINLPNFITIADFNLPVGLGGVPILQPGYGVSAPATVLSEIIEPGSPSSGTSDLPPEIDRRDEASVNPIVPMEETLPISDLGPNVTTVLWGQQGIYEGMSNEEWLAVMFPGAQPMPTPVATTEAEIVNLPQEEDVSWIEDIYTSADDIFFGGRLPGGAPSPGPAPVMYNPPMVTPSPTVTPQPGTPAAVVNPAIKQYCYKFVDGQWKLVKMRRSRRKQLATKGDLQDLAALKGILGLGKAFEVWIATHS